MIDKLWISTNDFQVENDSGFRIFRPSYMAGDTEPAEGGVLYSTGTRFVYGSKAVMNTKKFNLTINPNFGLEVHWNPAVIMHNGNNYHKVSESEFRESLNIVSDALIDEGVFFDFESCSIAKLHLANDKEMNEPFPVYVPLFRMLDAKRAKPIEYYNGYYFTNGNRTLVFYGKHEEMQRKGKQADSCSETVMRCEYRLNTRDSVRRFSGFNNIAEIRNASFSTLAELQRNSITDFAFGDISEPSFLSYSHSTEVEILREFRKVFKRNALARYNETRFLLERYGSAENYKSVLLDAGFNRTYVFKHMKAIRKAISFIDRIESANGKTTIGSLYNEVYDRFIREAA